MNMNGIIAHKVQDLCFKGVMDYHCQKENSLLMGGLIRMEK